MSKLYIVRGVPGSGKTTYARKQLVPMQSTMYEADEFHNHPVTGKYEWKPELMEYAHAYCLSNTAHRLRYGLDVYVSNTFTQWFEIEKYLKLARALRCDVEIVTCTGKFDNVHDVPKEVLDKMAKRYITNEKIKQRVRLINKTTPEFGFFNMEISFKEYNPETDELISEGTIYEENK